MMSQLEVALRELESATTAVAEIAVDDFAEAKAAMDRRSWALADLSALASAPIALAEKDREDAMRRLQLASSAGDRAAQRLSRIRREAAEEWNRWSRIYRALGASTERSSSRVDCHG